YDDIQQHYSLDLANAYGRSTSPYALRLGSVVAVPSGLIRASEPVRLSAVICDSQGAANRHEIGFQAPARTIAPRITSTGPHAGFATPEGSDFELKFRAYDNVKVERIALYSAYAARMAGGSYLRAEYGAPLRTIDGIDPSDALPITTLNIDTPEYSQIVHV